MRTRFVLRSFSRPVNANRVNYFLSRSLLRPYIFHHVQPGSKLQWNLSSVRSFTEFAVPPTPNAPAQAAQATASIGQPSGETPKPIASVSELKAAFGEVERDGAVSVEDFARIMGKLSDRAPSDAELAKISGSLNFTQFIKASNAHYKQLRLEQPHPPAADPVDPNRPNTTTTASPASPMDEMSEDGSPKVVEEVPKAPRRSLYQFLGDESKHLAELRNKGRKGSKARKRTLADIKDVDWSKVWADAIEKEKEAVRLAELENNTEYKGSKDLVFIADKETVWDQRIARLKSKIKGGATARKLKAVRLRLDTSDNPLIVQVREAKERYDDKKEALSEAYETSQHPLVWKLRAVVDGGIGESEEGWAKSKLLEADPFFDELSFLEEMENYMIPAVVPGFRGMNRAMMEVVCENQALRQVNASFKERETTGHHWETGILHIDIGEISRFLVVENTPLVVLAFSCQHRNMVRDNEGVIVKGSEYGFITVTYMWVLRRDTTSEYFNYKIVEMATNEVFSLV